MFYSYLIFDLAGVSNQHIQYAVLSTGVVYFVISSVVLPCVNKNNWRIFLIVSMIIMAICYGLLAILIEFKVKLRLNLNKFLKFYYVLLSFKG